ncbi:MAG: hypothetical protein V2A73_21960 [Pseudomonadota bacterium]
MPSFPGILRQRQARSLQPALLAMAAACLLALWPKEADAEAEAGAEAGAGAGGCIEACGIVRTTGGLFIGGGSSGTTFRPASVILSGMVERAIAEQPRISMLGGMLLEIGGRLGTGAEVGIRGKAQKGRTRLAVVVDYFIAPYSFFGVGFEVGACWSLARMPGVALCLDGRCVSYFAGSDLPEGVVLARIGVVAGIEFDVF